MSQDRLNPAPKKSAGKAKSSQAKSATEAEGEDMRKRSAARLLAVQTIYSQAITGAALERVLQDAQAGRLPHEGRLLASPDSILLADLAQGVAARAEDIDRMLSEALPSDWPLARIEAVLVAIMRCGVAELLYRPDIPAPATIQEFLRVAEAFYGGPEPGMVNAVLDRIARILRPEEMAEPRAAAERAS